MGWLVLLMTTKPEFCMEQGQERNIRPTGPRSGSLRLIEASAGEPSARGAQSYGPGRHPQP